MEFNALDKAIDSLTQVLESADSNIFPELPTNRYCGFIVKVSLIEVNPVSLAIVLDIAELFQLKSAHTNEP